MAAAEHGASFPKAKAIRASVTHQQMHDFAATPNSAMKPMGKAPTLPAPHPHSNLGKWLHPKKSR